MQFAAVIFCILGLVVFIQRTNTAALAKTYRVLVVAAGVLALLWIGAFVQIVTSEEIPTNPHSPLPRECVSAERSASWLAADDDPRDAPSVHSLRWRLVPTSDRPIHFVAVESRPLQQIHLTLVDGADIVATHDMRGTLIDAMRDGDGYLVWSREVGRDRVRIERLDESLRPVQAASYVAPEFRQFRLFASPPSSYCAVVSMTERYLLLGTDLQPRSRIWQWVRRTSLVSPLPSLAVLLVWCLVMAFRRGRWRSFAGQRRYEGAWRHVGADTRVEVEGEIYRVEMPADTTLSAISDGEPCVLHASPRSEDDTSPYRDRSTLVVTKWFPGSWADLRERHRARSRKVAVFAIGVLLVLGATAASGMLP